MNRPRNKLTRVWWVGLGRSAQIDLRCNCMFSSYCRPISPLHQPPHRNVLAPLCSCLTTWQDHGQDGKISYNAHTTEVHRCSMQKSIEVLWMGHFPVGLSSWGLSKTSSGLLGTNNPLDPSIQHDNNTVWEGSQFSLREATSKANVFRCHINPQLIQLDQAQLIAVDDCQHILNSLVWNNRHTFTDCTIDGGGVWAFIRRYSATFWVRSFGNYTVIANTMTTM